MTTVEIQSPKPRRLRVFRVVFAVFKYCLHNFGRLFLVTWFACALASVSRLFLEWLIFPWPARLPDWMLSSHFDPPTWLSPFLVTPWLAMGWAFVLNEMFHENPRRGIVTIPPRELGWLRFELSRAVLIAAAILAVASLIDGATRFAQDQILVAADAAFEPSEITLTIWAGLLTALRVALIVVVFVLCYPLAGRVLHTGDFSVARTWKLMHGNWLRVAGIFLLLNIILRGLVRILEPVTDWLVQSFTNSADWTLQAALVRFVVDFPFQMLWTLVWAVAVGIVLHTLEGSSSSVEPAGDE